MKQKSFLLSVSIIFLACLFLTACNGYESPLQGKQLEDLTFDASQSFKDISFDGQDVSNLSIHSSDTTWCFPGVFDSKLRVAVLDNQTFEERRATIIVTDREDGSNATFTVIQLQNDAIITDQSEYEVPVEGGIITMKLQTNVSEYDMILHADWMTPVTRTRGLQPAECQISVAENRTPNVREGIVEFVKKEGGTVSQATIRQLARPYITFESSIVTVGEAGGEISVNVTSNIDFRAEVENRSQSWVQAGTRTDRGNNQYVQKFQVSVLPADIDSRRCIVYFVKSDLSYSNELTIEQRRE